MSCEVSQDKSETQQAGEPRAKRSRLETVAQYRIKTDLGVDTVRAPLPDGWVEIPHHSGMTVYFHKMTRVCSCSRPYYASQQSSVRSCLIPLSAIPCLERKQMLKRSDQQTDESCSTGKSTTLENEELREYLRKLWQFDVREISRKRRLEECIKPAVSKRDAADVSLTHESRESTVTEKITKLPIVKTAGRPPQAILHDYCERVLKSACEWTFKEGEGSFVAEVFVGASEERKRYGQGAGRRKTEAKKRAAEEALSVLMPEFKSNYNQECKGLKVDDVRVVEMSSAAGVDTSYMLLCEFVRRHKLIMDMKIEFNVTECKGGVKYEMVCGQHRVEGMSSNKQMAKNVAAQDILRLFHPLLSSWEDLLKLYSKDNEMNQISRHDEEVKHLAKTETTQLNQKLLDKLKEEMKKLARNRSSDAELKYESNSDTA
ncbi:microprocessor complex subunit DGCR8-like isoform X2 [Corticium candelabrum]|uniref:microprocessor complex subunit DGCR8-like isoform X2 n=1 Tax=Corticium candelabrum TaxID=121492 RepID=UPI002E26BED0|nr:microprocessor complex subunit DGCR8-like isoform X2 [Corticium candelabrum]